MNRHFRHSGIRAAALLIAAFAPTACLQADLFVELKDNPVVSDREVRLSDIASVTGTSRNEAALAGNIDVAVLKSDETAVRINRSYLGIRIALAGWDRDSVRIDGPDSITIRFREPEPLSDSDIESAATVTMQQVLGTAPEDIRVRLRKPFVQTLPAGLQKRAGIRVEVSPPAATRIGMVTLTVRLFDGSYETRRIAQFDVLRRHRVAVTRVSLTRSDTIDNANIQFENRFLSGPADEPDEQQVYGKRVKRNLGPGQIVSLTDLAAAPAGENKVVIRRREKVGVTAVSGPLRLHLQQAEALEDGRVGDFITLRNLQSGRNIVGKVTESGRVEIRLR